MNLCVIDDADAKRHGHGNLLSLVLCVMASNIVDMVRSIILLLFRRGRLLGLCIVAAIFLFVCIVFVAKVLLVSFSRRPNLILFATNISIIYSLFSPLNDCII